MELSEGQNNNMLSKNQELPETELIGFGEALSQIPKSQREKLIGGYDMKKLAKVFNDAGTMRTIEIFLKNGMNVSRAARVLYMHRNTLIYKLNSIRRLTGLDLRDFDMAVTFCILHTLYVLK